MVVEANSSQVSLKEYIDTRLHADQEMRDARLEALEKQIQVSLKSQETAILKAEAATEKRFESVNEFRATLTDQAATFASRASFESLEASLLAKIDALNNAQASELKGLRDTLLAKIETVAAASQIRIEAERNANTADSKALWKALYGLGIALATIQAIVTFSPGG